MVNEQVETKIFRTTTQGVDPAPGVVIPLFGIMQGLTTRDRVGDRIKLVGIHLNYSIGSTIAQTAEYRYLLYKRPTGAGYNLTPPAGTINEIPDPDIITTKKDVYGLLGPFGSTQGVRTFRYSKRWGAGGQVVTFDGAGAATTLTGQWYLWVVTGVGGGNSVLFGQITVYYKDA